MPSKNCVRYHGRIYYYDKVKNKAYVYEEKEIKFDEFPNSVLEVFTKNKDFKEIEIRE